jgi:hypothetical protein
MSSFKDSAGLWRKYDKNGKEYYYLSVSIGDKKYQFNCFQNKFKNEGDKTPDFKSAPERKLQDNSIKIDPVTVAAVRATMTEEDCPF